MTPLLADLFALVPRVLPSGAASQLVVFLYLGPQTVLPLASFLAATLGILLLFGRQIVSLVRRGFRAVRRRIKVVPPDEPELADTPQKTDE
jgi:hypothetical protein